MIAIGTDPGATMSVRMSSLASTLPAATVRDVLKTLVELDVRRQTEHSPSVEPAPEAPPTFALTSEEALEKKIDELVEREPTAHRDVPIQIGFGFGAMLPRRTG